VGVVENSFGNIQILRSVTAQGDVLHQPTTPVVKGPHPSAKTSCAYPVPWKNIKTKALRKSLLRQVQWVTATALFDLQRKSWWEKPGT
jgi:hypothetical protein